MRELDQRERAVRLQESQVEKERQEDQALLEKVHNELRHRLSNHFIIIFISFSSFRLARPHTHCSLTRLRRVGTEVESILDNEAAPMGAGISWSMCLVLMLLNLFGLLQ